MAAGEPPHVAVVGAGWGGWAAAQTLVENGCRVTLLDSLPDPTGETPYLTPTGKPFEAGTRGFWKDYPNIEALTRSLGLREEDVFTPFTNSSFYSPDGLEATAPVFSSTNLPFSDAPLPELPSPLGQVLATFQLFERIPVPDRVTVLGLLYATIDFTRDEEAFRAYDRMTAHELFLRMGISERFVRDFLKPTLLIGLFKPPEELSAAVAMELLYFYALAHQTSFDVRWIRYPSISELLIAPLARSLLAKTLPPAGEAAGEAGGGPGGEDSGAGEADGAGGAPALTVLGGSRVQSVQLDAAGKVSGLSYASRGGSEALTGLNGCVLALGSKGMSGVVGGSPELARAAPELCKAASLGGIDVIACRLWLDTTVETRTPANVFSRFEALRGAGGTFFMLDQLQGPAYGGGDEALRALWGGDEPQGSVVACDFYNSGASAHGSDLLPAAVPGFSRANVVDSFVARYPGAVSWFSPGSFDKRPPLQTRVPNLVCAGDWVRMGEFEHGAKGLCQERAYVSGIEAANALARSGALGVRNNRVRQVSPVRDDEPQVVAGRAINKQIYDSLLKPLGLDKLLVR
ncbi:hypothetical protein EMIHUDRAFT_349982 [Emiliania huxleyi CCMP1516]|uniref:Amine oxidase domain-containing protein n=2 Tax=Emiliania huxleyi TaxID=2903 RepID=A0A0D3J477_EMIH1|nr:hypothetical protein EMIHUDRAFT_349982 [Emiliania huxleyi CCMP1516]EOD18312.1 hypothetical protein EMIHUDRAFT_349982 [Emiliania huxleyi CCMP1516]|eukprot:XP_005770741.1 hypothetical protein EMIHUDRAFT_349982 [Emiliania huxleyi CCMP1516]